MGEIMKKEDAILELVKYVKQQQYKAIDTEGTPTTSESVQNILLQLVDCGYLIQSGNQIIGLSWSGLALLDCARGL
jgi:hypothetical protein